MATCYVVSSYKGWAGCEISNAVASAYAEYVPEARIASEYSDRYSFDLPCQYMVDKSSNIPFMPTKVRIVAPHSSGEWHKYSSARTDKLTEYVKVKSCSPSKC